MLAPKLQCRNMAAELNDPGKEWKRSNTKPRRGVISIARGVNPGKNIAEGCPSQLWCLIRGRHGMRQDLQINIRTPGELWLHSGAYKHFALIRKGRCAINIVHHISRGDTPGRTITPFQGYINSQLLTLTKRIYN